MYSSRLQAYYFSQLGHDLHFKLQPGTSTSIRFPQFGPYDNRLGYSRIADFTKSLQAHHYQISQQASLSPQLAHLELPPIYAEKDQAGLNLLDCNHQPLYSALAPSRVYDRFDAIPKVLVDSLLFIEDRELLNTPYATRNPAVNWSRLNRALFDQVLHAVDSSHDTPGASTLITQIEKYRHSPEGRTNSPREKLLQMQSASIRAYMKGENTLPIRQQIVVAYLNTVPLTAKPGIGEINGLGDGMRAWYGRDFTELNRMLNPRQLESLPRAGEPLQRTAQVYKEALSLMIAQRRPFYYLHENPAALEQLTNRHLRLLGAAGVISQSLQNAALPIKLSLNHGPVRMPVESFVTRKAVSTLRADLAALLHVPRLYDLDRLDLTVDTTLNGDVQAAVTQVLRQLKSPDGAKAAGLYGYNMLYPGDDPARLTFSFTLFERGTNANLLRVQTDNLDQPFDINEGARLNLGSTAKLRTLITYLEVMTRLHRRYAGMTPQELQEVQLDKHDALSRWAVDYFAAATDKSLGAMLEAAMERKYSGNPAEGFLTGGGLQHFENFEREENGKNMTVREGFQHSVNLVFVRLMRDIVRHYIANSPNASVARVAGSDDSKRQAMLSRFADREGREFLTRFYKKYAGKTPQDQQDLLLETVHTTPHRLAIIYRTLEPGADLAQFSRFMREHVTQPPSDKALQDLYEKFAADKFSLEDRGYLAGVHPLELWLAGYLRHQPHATLTQALAASRDERQEAYRWLFKTPNKRTQDKRIAQMLELEAFLEIARDWHRLGYPFEALTPSYATALGASGDRPAALATLMGIIVNKGLQLPARKLEHLGFARATPYETHFVPGPGRAERLLPEEITEIVRRSLIDVVQGGTAKRLKEGFGQGNGHGIEVGGKTGTGDQRFETYAPGGHLISSRAVNRSGTFVFFLGDRFFGTMTAYAHEPYAADYRFTSALSVQLLKSLAPVLKPLMESAGNPHGTMPDTPDGKITSVSAKG